jgi:hypothetical protein
MLFPLLENARDEALRRVVAIGVGGVEEIDAFVEAHAQSIERFGVIDRSLSGADWPSAEPDFRH